MSRWDQDSWCSRRRRRRVFRQETRLRSFSEGTRGAGITASGKRLLSLSLHLVQAVEQRVCLAFSVAASFSDEGGCKSDYLPSDLSHETQEEGA